MCVNDSLEDKHLEKYFSCKHSFYSKDKYKCLCPSVIEAKEGDSDSTSVEIDICKDCTGCELYKSIYIEYPIVVDKIDTSAFDKLYDYSYCKPGTLVSIRTVGEDKKTYFGISIGDLPLNPSVFYNSDSKTLRFGVQSNPAFFVPDLNKVVFGAESFWCKIEDMDHFKEITDSSIKSQWYMKLAEDYFSK